MKTLFLNRKRTRFLFVSRAPFYFTGAVPRLQIARGKVAIAWGRYEFGLFWIPKLPDGFKVVTPNEATYSEDDMVGPGHELYPMMMDAIKSEGPVFYERNPKTGKLEKKDIQ